MTKEEQIKIINDAIIQTKTSLKPLGYNLLFWGILIISMSLFHFQRTIQDTKLVGAKLLRVLFNRF